MDYYPKDLAEVDKITPEVAHEIRNQYILAYLADESHAGRHVPQDQRDGEGSGNPTVRTRNGYYATQPNAKNASPRLQVGARILWRASKGYRLQPVAKSVSQVAHRNLLGLARRKNHQTGFLPLPARALAGTAASRPLGGPDERAVEALAWIRAQGASR